MSIEGKWTNELGSTMELQLGGDGALTGTYLSSKAGNDKETEPLSGRCRVGNSGVFAGWTVCFSSTDEPDDEPTVCSWSGRYTDVGGSEVIDTTWLLTQTTDETGQWDSTLVGKNTFRRT